VAPLQLLKGDNREGVAQEVGVAGDLDPGAVAAPVRGGEDLARACSITSARSVSMYSPTLRAMPSGA
jgi:hypothetical protein